jgi:hypothetical protein
LFLKPILYTMYTYFLDPSQLSRELSQCSWHCVNLSFLSSCSFLPASYLFIHELLKIHKKFPSPRKYLKVEKWTQKVHTRLYEYLYLRTCVCGYIELIGKWRREGRNFKIYSEESCSNIVQNIRSRT